MRTSGTIKFFHQTHGFGFIAPGEGGRDVFLHASALERAALPSLAPGAKVSYEVTTGRNGGRQATSLRPD